MIKILVITLSIFYLLSPFVDDKDPLRRREREREGEESKKEEEREKEGGRKREKERERVWVRDVENLSERNRDWKGWLTFVIIALIWMTPFLQALIASILPTSVVLLYFSFLFVSFLYFTFILPCHLSLLLSLLLSIITFRFFDSFPKQNSLFYEKKVFISYHAYFCLSVRLSHRGRESAPSIEDTSILMHDELKTDYLSLSPNFNK